MGSSSKNEITLSLGIKQLFSRQYPTIILFFGKLSKASYIFDVHIEVGFLFYLYPITTINSLYCLKQNCSSKKAFAMPNQTWLCLVKEKMLYLPNILTIGCTKINVWIGGRHWCQGGLHPEGEEYTYQCEIMCPHPMARGETHCRVAAEVHCLKCKAWKSCRILSQMWGTWNLPIFLLKDGSLTLKNIASLMFLVILCTSLPTVEKLSTLILCPALLPYMYMGEGDWRCSLSLSPKELPY